ncbi:unnamed protein product [Rhizophagus irregularis]|nr:unnamed protein product [Rhizophagus irregularis]CAB5366541.1 unnamed protein product [Rhizophagus irregularis]
MLNEILKILQCLAYLSMTVKDSYSLANRVQERFVTSITKTEIQEIIEEVERQITILDKEIKEKESNLLSSNPETEEELFLPTRLREDYCSPERLDEWLGGWEFIDNHDFSDEEKILVVDKELAVKEKLRDGWSRLRCELYVMLND